MDLGSQFPFVGHSAFVGFLAYPANGDLGVGVDGTIEAAFFDQLEAFDQSEELCEVVGSLWVDG